MLEPPMTGTPTEIETQAELRAAIDGLYTAFAGYPRPGSFEACACCWPGEPVPGDAARVVVPAPGGDRPLRQLTADELGFLAGKVLTTGGTLDVLRHYLPRLLELVVGEGFAWPDLEAVFGRLAYGPLIGGPSWTGWPAPEQDAVRRFLHAFWPQRLATGRDVDDDGAGEALCAIGLVDPDIGWYLDKWLRFDHPHAAGNLQRFLILNASARHRGRLSDAFWSTDRAPAPENQRRVVAWTRAPATRDAVAAAADRARTPAERDALDEIYLRWLD
jgi:hypothetical protein